MPLLDGLHVLDEGIHIPIELGTRILHILTTESYALCLMIRELSNRRAEIDSLVRLLNIALPNSEGTSTS